jgi:hypothetical protein
MVGQAEFVSRREGPHGSSEHMPTCLSEMVTILLIAGFSPASSSAVIKKDPALAGTICCAQVMMVRAIGVGGVNRHLGLENLILTNEFKIQLEIEIPRRVL